MHSQAAARKAVRRWRVRAGRLSLLLALLALAGLSSAAIANHNTTELVSTGPVGGAAPLDARFGSISADGTRVFFQTPEALTLDDTDGGLVDIYERSGGQPTLLSKPSAGVAESPGQFGANFGGATADGSRVFFETDDALVAADADGGLFDIYERSGGTTTLISTGPTGGDGIVGAGFEGISEDGARVFFLTDESLVASDNDAQSDDIYERSGNTTTLLSDDSTEPDAPIHARFAGASADGSRVAITTDESLDAGADTDSRIDIYVYSGGTTTLVTTGPAGGNGDFEASFGAISDDGTRIVFETQDGLVPADTDASYYDVYQRSFDTTPSTTLLSDSPLPTDGAFDARFVGASDDGTRVFFDTDEALTADDSDGGGLDVYRSFGGTLLNVSGGAGFHQARFLGVTGDGARVFFDTRENLVVGDDDGLLDVYERSGSTSATLVSPGGSDAVDVCMTQGGPVECGIFFSDTGARVFLNTDAALTPGDADGAFDIYERFGGVTTLITGSGQPQDATLRAVSADMGLVFFETQESLAGDADGGALDVFSSRFVQPALVISSSPPPAPTGQTPPVPSLTATVSGARTQRVLLQGGVVVIVICNKRCEASATGSISVPGASKLFRLKPTKRSVSPNKKTQLRLKLTGKARKAISRALRRKKKLRAKIRLTVVSGGESRSSKLTVNLKR